MATPNEHRPEPSDERRVQRLLDAVRDYAIYMLDPYGGISSWNTGAERLKGYSRSEILGQNFARFFPPEDQAAGVPGNILREAAARGRYEAEAWRVRKDGTRFWANVVVDPIRDENGTLLGFAKVTRDITQRKAAQDALVESERRFRLLVQSVVDYAIYMLDPSGIVSNWNAGAERMKGYTAAEIVGQHFSRFYSKEDRAAGLPARVLDTAAREGRYEAEGQRVRKDGTTFWASIVVDAIRDENGALVGFAKITRDITERRAVQEAMRESERHLRLLIRGVKDYALYMLDPNGVVSSWNAGAERAKGYSEKEIVGQHFSRFYTEIDRAAGLPARALHSAEREGRYEAEGWRVRKDGSTFWASVVIDAIRDDDGSLVGFAKITRDITERRAAQIALQEAQLQRAHNQKMEAIGQLTGGVAHDFNNLLAIVGGYVQILKKLVAGNPRGLRAAEAIETAAQRGETLTRQLLSFSRRQILKPAVVEIGDLIGAARPMIESSAGAPTRVLTQLASDTWRVKVDASEFQLALINLALNARDAMPQGGTITISAENQRLETGDTPQPLAGEFVAITVADTGAGIPPDILPRIFDPFFTTKEVDKGTGLGLSQVHGFAHQSGGTVTVASTLGQGTRFTLYLPRTAETETEAASTEEGPAPELGGTLLLVEDNPEVSAASVALMEDLGYRIRTAGNAEAALRAIEDQPVDLVISDIVMAGSLDGIGLAREIRQRHPHMPIILVTGYSDAASQAGREFKVLRKPYRLAELSRAIAQITAGRTRPRPDNLVSLQDHPKARSSRNGLD